MNYIKYLIIFIINFFIFFGSLNADCEYSEIKEQNTLASYVNYDYTYVGDISIFNVTLNNVNPKLKVIFNDKEYTQNGNQVVLNNLDANDQNNVKIYSVSCEDEYLREIKVTLPFYNVYSQNLDCKYHPDFEYCAEFLSFNLDGTRFYKGLEEYNKKKSEEAINKEEKTQTKTGIIEKIKVFFNKYGLVLSIVGEVIAIGIIVVIIIIKRKKIKF